MVLGCARVMEIGGVMVEVGGDKIRWTPPFIDDTQSFNRSPDI
jgi:hypothetical protein